VRVLRLFELLYDLSRVPLCPVSFFCVCCFPIVALLRCLALFCVFCLLCLRRDCRVCSCSSAALCPLILPLDVAVHLACVLWTLLVFSSSRILGSLCASFVVPLLCLHLALSRSSLYPRFLQCLLCFLVLLGRLQHFLRLQPPVAYFNSSSGSSRLFCRVCALVQSLSLHDTSARSRALNVPHSRRTRGNSRQLRRNCGQSAVSGPLLRAFPFLRDSLPLHRVVPQFFSLGLWFFRGGFLFFRSGLGAFDTLLVFARLDSV